MLAAQVVDGPESYASGLMIVPGLRQLAKHGQNAGNQAGRYDTGLANGQERSRLPPALFRMSGPYRLRTLTVKAQPCHSVSSADTLTRQTADPCTPSPYGCRLT